MDVLPLMQHPQLARFKTILDGSPTAREWMTKMESTPVALSIGSPMAEQMGQMGALGVYNPLNKTVYIPQSVMEGYFTHPGTGERTPLNDAFVSTVLLHEGVHSVQFGHRTLPGKVARFVSSPIRDAVRGVANVVTGRDGGTPVGRFVRGVDASMIQPEVEAHRVQGHVMSELHVPGEGSLQDLVPNGQPATTAQVMDHIMKMPPYVRQIHMRWAKDAAIVAGATYEVKKHTSAA